jgi:hypothetical protein
MLSVAKNWINAYTVSSGVHRHSCVVSENEENMIYTTLPLRGSKTFGSSVLLFLRGS